MAENRHGGGMENSIARKPDGLLFDLWGTLISSEGFEPGAGHAAVLALCDNPRAVPLAEVLSLGDRVVTALNAREEESALEFTQASLLRIVFDSFGLRPRQSMAECEWAFWHAALKVRLIDGVLPLLEALSGAGMPLGVVSNSSFTCSVLERELERLGARSHFQFVISSADYGVRKPHPLIFEVALRRLGLEPNQVWFAGDTITYDVQGAADAGIFPVAFNPSTDVPRSFGAHAVITRWEQLISLITAAR
jgi:putative hydrolase of the HAD superfamily